MRAILFSSLVIAALLGLVACGQRAEPGPDDQVEVGASGEAPVPTGDPTGQEQTDLGVAAGSGMPQSDLHAPAVPPPADPGRQPPERELEEPLAPHGPYGDVPPPPPGYETAEEAMRALTIGELEAIQPPPAEPEGLEVVRGVEYAKVTLDDGTEKSLRLDVYMPGDATGAAPAILFIHGGAWSGGDRAQLAFYSVHFAAQGYVCANPSYRLSDEATFPAAVQDVKAALRFLRANAEDYGVDPERIAASGNSAGGHLALMLAYTANSDAFEPIGGYPDVRDDVACVVNFYGPVDLTTAFARGKGSVSSFLGATYEDNPGLYEKASPVTYIDAEDPPTLTFHGSTDDIVPVEQARILDAALEEVGVLHQMRIIEGFPHSMDVAEPVNAYCRATMEIFFDGHLDTAGAGAEAPPEAPEEAADTADAA